MRLLLLKILRRNDLRIQILLGLLLCALFFGNAILSISYIIFIIGSLSELKKINFRELLKNRISSIMIYFFLISLLVLLLNMDRWMDLFHIEKILPFLIAPLVFQAYNWDSINREIKWNIFWAFFLASIINLIVNLSFAFFRYLKFDNSIYFTYNHLSEPFGVQPIYLSIFYLTSILLSLELKNHYKTLYPKLYWIAIILLFFGIILLSSRTTIFISAILCVVWVFSKVKKNNHKFYLLSFLVSVAVTSSLLIPTLRDRLFHFQQNVTSYSGSSLRFKIWENVLEVIKLKPLLGYGYGISQNSLANHYKDVNFRRAYMNDLNAHNQYLQTLIDSGIIGLLFLVLIFYFFYINNRRCLLQISFCLVISISFITESMLNRQYGVIFVTFFMLMLNRTKDSKNKDCYNVNY